MYIVTFRNSYDQLTSMFIQKFKTVAEAKAMIELDGRQFLSAHAHRMKRDVKEGKKYRQTSGWKQPNTADYYEVRGKDGVSCVWQYFKV